MTFDPATKDANVNDTIDIKTIVNAGAEEINSVDAYIKYDSTMLEFQKLTEGDFFPIVLKEEISDGNLYIGAYVVPGTIPAKTGTGTYSTITFKALKEGTTTVEYFCDESVNETTEIIKADTDSTNIINCSGNGTSVITIGSSGEEAPTSTPTPTLTDAPADEEDTSTGGTGGSDTVADTTDEVTELPQSGILDNILRISIPWAALLLIGAALKLLL